MVRVHSGLPLVVFSTEVEVPRQCSGFRLRADTKTLAVVTPGILGPDYFREIAAVVAAAAGAPPNPGAIAEVMRRHGLTPVP